MTYRKPMLNITCRIWRGPHATSLPPSTQADLDNVPCQLRLTRVAFLTLAGQGQVTVMGLELPPKTDIRAPSLLTISADVVEVPSGTGRFYLTLAVDDVARGFSNEYRLAAIQQLTAVAGGWPAQLS